MMTAGTSTTAALEACYTKAEAMAVGVIDAQMIAHAMAQHSEREYLARVRVYLEAEKAKAEFESTVGE